jgi:histidyl-tRNA synthetase
MSKKAQIKAVRGMNDILPTDSGLWQQVEAVCAEILNGYSYAQIRTPIVESTHLFARSIGADTDVVSKEMYTFEDRNGDSLTLRPEGTASCVRAGIEHGLFYNQQQRLWYIGPMFRHERPQKGRYRQFTQIGAECYGWSTPDVEAELIGLTAQIFARLELGNTKLLINSLGDDEARTNYRSALVSYLSQYQDKLDEDSLRRLQSNPLRILDSKNPAVQALLIDAPSILDYLNEASAKHFDLLQNYLTGLGVEFTVSPRLVRGLDSYNDTVFEWVNEDFGAQSTVCGGGRYDQMVEQLGGNQTPCFGFAMGVERLVQMLQEQNAAISLKDRTPEIFIVSVGDTARGQAIVVQRNLVERGVWAQLYCGAASMKNQFKKADKSGAKIVLIIGEEEADQDLIGIRPLIKTNEAIDQQIIPQNEAFNAVTNLLESL